MDLSLTSTVYRLLDLLDSIEAYMAQADSNLSLECILSANQARQAVTKLESDSGLDMKAFLRERVENSEPHIATRLKMQ